MPTWRVKTNNAADPTAVRSMVPAAAPPYTPTPYSVHGGLVRFAAAPGTVPIAAPPSAGMSQRGWNRSAVYGDASPEEMARGNLDLRPQDVTPNAWYPRLDVPFADNMTPPVRWVCTNEIPIPAGNYTRLPQIASQAPPRIGGSGVIPAPRAFTRWPSIVANVPSDN
jgi:hypothetical protein